MLKRHFVKGRMDKDTDERLLENGVVRHAENVHAINSEGSDEGAIENILSNKVLTNLPLGSNIQTVLKYEDTTRLKLYWVVISDAGAFLVEYDIQTKTSAFILKDTRPEGERIFDIKRNKYITGVVKIITENVNKDLFILTDNNIEPLCINLERAKSYGENGFEKEDVYLIKKPPFFAPKLTSLLIDTVGNNILEDFFSFGYRYQYLDDEYSAISPLSNYEFTNKEFDFDFYDLINNGMVNRFNAVRITFNTGDKRVKKIQLVFKKSNSNTNYLIETFNKTTKGWGDNLEKSFVFANNTLYTALPEKELYRPFDNVPRKADALALIGSRLGFGDYVEGHNLLTNDNNPVVLDYSVGYKSYSLEERDDLDYTYPNTSTFTFNTPGLGIEYKSGSSLFIEIKVNFEDITVYSNVFQFILEQDFNSLVELVQSESFTNFTNYINIDFQNHYNEEEDWDVNEYYALITEPEITFALNGTTPTFTITPIVYEDTANSNATVTVTTEFGKVLDEGQEAAPVTYSNLSSGASAKSLKTYTVGFIYVGEFGRCTTVLQHENGNIFIPQSESVNINKLLINVRHKPPHWAKYFRLSVKTNPLLYHIIYVNEYYNDGVYVWVKLEGGNKDKVKVGDYLNVKTASGLPLSQPVQVKVLDIAEKDKDFIDGNQSETANGDLVDIIESRGLYMKIRPRGFSMDLNDYTVYQDNSYNDTDRRSRGGQPKVFLSLFSEENEGAFSDLSIGTGTSVYLILDGWRYYKKGRRTVRYEKEFFASRDYDSIEQFLKEAMLNGNPVTATEQETDETKNIKDNVSIRRGHPTGSYNGFTDDPTKGLWLEYTGYFTDPGGDRNAYARGEIIIRKSTGIYVFETVPLQNESEFYFETGETFKIENGYHFGNVQNQDANAPAIIESKFFNCFAFGNGVESFRVKDDFNTRFLNIDLRPSAVDENGYKEIRRFADITYSEPYVPGTGLNGLNEFNMSTANFKELNKEHGAIEVLQEREGNLLTVQRHHWGYVLFDKDAMYNTDGTANVGKVPYVLGEWVPYAGLYGTSNPESFAFYGNRYYAVDKERGVVLRLSTDGLTVITWGMKDWFRDIFHQNPTAFVLGGIDPYNNLYQITIGDEPMRLLQLQCGNTITKHEQTVPFTYQLNINDLSGDVVLNYNITNGTADVQATFNGNTYYESGATGLGNLTFNRDSLTESAVTVTVTPTTESVSYIIENQCPVGVPITIVSIVLADNDDLGFTITNRYRWSNSNYYEENDLFSDTPITRWTEETGIEGQGKFPKQGATITMQAIKDAVSSGEFKIEDCNKMYYLISDTVYTNASIETLLTEANVLSLTALGTENYPTVQSAFAFSHSNQNQRLYMVWDYRSQSPVLNDDSASVQKGQSVTINVLDNDEVEASAVITVVTPPQNGTYVVNANGTITYTHDDTFEFEDSFVYQIEQNGCISQATVTITVDIPVPVAVNDNIPTVENGGSITYNILENDEYLEGLPITITLLSQPTNGTVVVNEDNTITFTHDGTDVTNGEFTYKINDTYNDSNVATVKVNSLIINADTKIRIFFDSSGSMNSTLTPLQTMRDTLLKDELLPLYNNDSDLYDANVTVISESSERTIQMLDINNEVITTGNVICLVFQDECGNYGVTSSFTENTDISSGNYDEDLSAFRNRLSSYSDGFYRGVLFQVSNSGYPEFKTFVQCIDEGRGLYTGSNGLSDRIEVAFKYDITNGGTAQYYMDLIVDALTELGYEL